MKISDDLTALIFELQRARSPRDKARAMARAWRTIRRLSPTERRLLAREVGFDGAEELVEGLAGKGGGVFAPAAVLEALGRMRKKEDLSLRGILADLKDPDRREDLLVRGIDLVDGAVGEDTVDEEIQVEAHPRASQPVLPPPPAIVESEFVVVPEPETQIEPESEIEGEVDQPHEPEPVVEFVESSSWDSVWQQPEPSESVMTRAARSGRTGRTTGGVQSQTAEGSVLLRLRAFRDAIPGLRGERHDEIAEILDFLPEPWARRRAVVALIEAGIPGDADGALDLIEKMERPMDRRWCLATLARRGDLEGDTLERALEMLASPAAKRRVEALASNGRASS